jgi:hypothetical protein
MDNRNIHANELGGRNCLIKQTIWFSGRAIDGSYCENIFRDNIPHKRLKYSGAGRDYLLLEAPDVADCHVTG